MAKLSDKDWVVIRDTDGEYLDPLSDALGMASASVMDAMYAQGLRIVREDRDDPSMDEMVSRIKQVIGEFEKAGKAHYAGQLDAHRVTARLYDLLKPDWKSK